MGKTTYKMVTKRGDVFIKAADLLSQKKFREAVFDAIGIVPKRVPDEEWDDIVQMIADVAIDANPVVEDGI